MSRRFDKQAKISGVRVESYGTAAEPAESGCRHRGVISGQRIDGDFC
ncbi:MAG: hypothetical protein ACXV8I_03430 [Methylobacter sp.]